MEANTAITPWVLLVAIGPTLLGGAAAFLKWYANEMLKKLEGATAAVAALEEEFEKSKAERALSDQRRDRDIDDLKASDKVLQQGHGETRQLVESLKEYLDGRIQKSSDAQTKALRDAFVELKQEITRTMLDVTAPRRARK